MEPADVSHAGQQHQPPHQLPVPTRPGIRYPSRNRLPPDCYRDLVPIEIVEESGAYSSEVLSYAYT